MKSLIRLIKDLLRTLPSNLAQSCSAPVERFKSLIRCSMSSVTRFSSPLSSQKPCSA